MFVAFDMDVFASMMNEMNDMHKELTELYNKLSELEG
jgi:hypothetical protein